MNIEKLNLFLIFEDMFIYYFVLFAKEVTVCYTVSVHSLKALPVDLVFTGWSCACCTYRTQSTGTRLWRKGD